MNMWLEALKEMKKRSGLSTKQIAEKTDIPERTVTRIFSGDTDNPYVDTLRRIVAVLGGTLDDVFAESKTVVGGQDLLNAQTELNRLTGENAALVEENKALKDSVQALTAEIDRLQLTISHKEEILKHKLEIIDVYKTFLGKTPKQ